MNPTCRPADLDHPAAVPVPDVAIVVVLGVAPGAPRGAQRPHHRAFLVAVHQTVPLRAMFQSTRRSESRVCGWAVRPCSCCILLSRADGDEDWKCSQNGFPNFDEYSAARSKFTHPFAESGTLRIEGEHNE